MNNLDKAIRQEERTKEFFNKLKDIEEFADTVVIRKEYRQLRDQLKKTEEYVFNKEDGSAFFDQLKNIEEKMSEDQINKYYELQKKSIKDFEGKIKQHNTPRRIRGIKQDVWNCKYFDKTEVMKPLWDKCEDRIKELVAA